jgi:hypothetical protein
VAGLHVPTVWSCPAVGDEIAFELPLAFRQVRRIVEPLDSVCAVGIGDHEFVAAARRVVSLAAHELPVALKPPEHATPPMKLFGRSETWR